MNGGDGNFRLAQKTTNLSDNQKMKNPKAVASTILLNGSYAPSLTNFRGPFICAMIAAGHNVHVTAPDIPANIKAEVMEMGAIVHQVGIDRAGTNFAKDIAYFFEMRRLIKAIQPNIVIGYTIKPNIWGGLAARSCGIKSASFVTGLGYAFIGGDGIKRKLIGFLSRFLYWMTTNGNDVVIFQNPDDRQDFIDAKCLAEPAKARLVNGSGVDLAKFTVAPLPEKAIFLFIGRLLVAKGIREYVAAGLQLLSQNKNAEIRIAGFLDTGPDSVNQRELDEWIAQGVIFLGALDDVRPAISQASIYVLPSYREGTPRTILEAMAMGRPIISTDVPGCRETVIHGKTGLLVPVRQVTPLLNAMIQLASDHSQRHSFGSAARTYCEEKYDVTKVNSMLLSHLGL